MEEEVSNQEKPFLGVYFERCSTYGRFYKNREGTAYVGRCPRCGASFKVRIGSEGTQHRFFKAICPGR